MAQEKYGRTGLYLAARDNQFAEVKRLVQSAKSHGILETMIEKADNEGKTPLFIASFFGNLKIVKVLLWEKAKIDQTDNDGSTSLMAAVHEGHLDIVNLLLDHNANIEMTTNNNATALYFAGTKNRFAEAKQLVKSAKEKCHSI